MGLPVTAKQDKVSGIPIPELRAFYEAIGDGPVVLDLEGFVEWQDRGTRATGYIGPLQCHGRTPGPARWKFVLKYVGRRCPDARTPAPRRSRPCSRRWAPASSTKPAGMRLEWGSIDGGAEAADQAERLGKELAALEPRIRLTVTDSDHDLPVFTVNSRGGGGVRFVGQRE